MTIGAGPESNRSRIHYAWVILGTLCLVLLVSSGMRSTFGVFIKYFEAEFGWSRTSLSLVGSLSLFLYGAIGPLVGRLADRFGPRTVIAASLAILVIGTFATSQIGTQWQLFLTAGVLMALGAGGAAMSTAGSVAARWFEGRRGLVMGIAGAGMSAGQLLIFPLATWLILTMGWRQSYFSLATGLLIVVLPIAIGLIRNDPKDMGLRPYGAGTETARAPAGGNRIERQSLA